MDSFESDLGRFESSGDAPYEKLIPQLMADVAKNKQLLDAAKSDLAKAKSAQAEAKKKGDKKTAEKMQARIAALKHQVERFYPMKIKQLGFTIKKYQGYVAAAKAKASRKN